MMQLLAYIFTWLSFQGLFKGVDSLFCNNEQRLYDKLFNNTYNPRQRPGNCSNEPVDVEISMWLQDILKLDEVDEVITASSWIQLKWLDERLAWNPEEYDNVDYLMIDTSSIWTPILVLENGVNHFKELVSTSVSKATLRQDGSVYLDFPLIHATFCKIAIAFFPFDIQNCFIQFSAQRVSINYLNLRSGDVSGDVGAKFKQWIIDALSSRSFISEDLMKQDELTFSVAEFEIQISRYAAYHLATNGLPLFLLSLIGVFIFLIPPESGERLSVGVSVLLGLTFFEFLVCDALPVSTSPPLLGIFWLGSFLFVALSVLLSLISVNISNRTDCIQGYTKRRVFLEILPTLLCVSKEKDISLDGSNNLNHDANVVVFENAVATNNEFPSSGNDSAVGSVNAVSLRTFPQSDVSKDDNHYSTGMEYTSASQVGCNNQEVSTDYKTVAKVLDRIFFGIIILMYLIFSVVVLTRRP